jgi:hypothetical protein
VRSIFDFRFSIFDLKGGRVGRRGAQPGRLPSNRKFKIKNRRCVGGPAKPAARVSPPRLRGE